MRPSERVAGTPPFRGAHAAEIQRKHGEEAVPDLRARREGVSAPFAEAMQR